MRFATTTISEIALANDYTPYTISKFDVGEVVSEGRYLLRRPYQPL